MLSEFHLKGVEEVAGSIQDLWEYSTDRWLSLRRPTRDKQVKHWPEDPAWRQLRAVRLAPASTGVVRQRIEEASEEMLVRGLMGYATSLAALRQRTDLVETFADAEPLVRSYLAKRDPTRRCHECRWWRSPHGWSLRAGGSLPTNRW